MKKTLFFALLACVSLLSHAASMPPAQRVAKAVEAMGGTGLSQLKTLVIKAHTKHWDPEQSYQPDGEMRFAGDSTYTQSRDLINNSARTDWQRKHLYPQPREYTYSEVVAGGIGFVNGVDATSRTKQSLESKPPQHAMSGIRVAAAVRELQRTSPALLLEMGQYPKRLSALSDQKAGGEILPAVRYQGENAAFIPDAKLGFVTDIWSPGRAPLGARLDAGQTALVNVVKRWGLAPERFAGGHGSVASFPGLLKIAPN